MMDRTFSIKSIMLPVRKNWKEKTEIAGGKDINMKRSETDPSTGRCGAIRAAAIALLLTLCVQRGMADPAFAADTGRGVLYIVGVGCGDPDLITLRAIETIQKADYLVCMEGIEKSFSAHIGRKPVLFDPLLQVPRFYRKKFPKKSLKECEREADLLYKKNIGIMKGLLEKGKSIALLEPGDPTLYGGWRNWVYPHFRKDDIRVVPGISAFNAANALFRDGIISKGAVIITEPAALMKDEALLANASKSGDTIVLFMAVHRVDALLPLLRKHYPGSTPVYLLYYAGYRDRERLVRTSVDGLAETAGKHEEKFLGLIYIGRHLK